MKNLLFLILLTGCANKLIFDPKSSTNPANFFADQMECERISEQVSYPEEMAKGAAIQGGASALLGALLASKNKSVTPRKWQKARQYKAVHLHCLALC
jgi:hypothetical protein